MTFSSIFEVKTPIIMLPTIYIIPLKDHELIPFKDNKEAMMGEPISKILLDAIEKSRMGRMAIIIFFKVFHVVLGRICV